MKSRDVVPISVPEMGWIMVGGHVGVKILRKCAKLDRKELSETAKLGCELKGNLTYGVNGVICVKI